LLPEQTILKLLLNYSQWQENSSKLSIEDFPKELRSIYSTINNYHSTNNDGVDLTIDDLSNLVFSMPQKDKDFTTLVIEQIGNSTAKEQTTKQLISAIQRNKLLKQISISTYEVAEGRMDVAKLNEQLALYNETDSHQEDKEEYPFISDDLEVLINSSVNSPGLRWRLNTLNQMLGSLRKGDFGFIFARPEAGKTTFLASEVTYMAQQLKEEDGPILWINNEEQGNKVMLRCYQASLGVDLTTLYSDMSVNRHKFLEQTNHKIKLYDSGTINRRTVEGLCKALQPSLVIFDQIDKISGFDSDREDLKLGAIYQWARELAKQYCPIIAVCQADGSGENVRWLTMGNVANAKTAKQAEADWILGIGKVTDPGYDNLRFLHLSKNKLLGDKDTIADQRHGRREVLIEPMVARYKDIK
jgi:AAA domain